MLDLGHLPEYPYVSTYIGTALTSEWQTWTKPRGIALIHILCVGGGSGGGGGFTRTPGNPGGGGGGGGGGNASTTLIPAYLLPDTLFVLAGAGGVGGAANSAGQPPTIGSIIAIAPGPTDSNSIIGSSFSAALPTGGAPGTAGNGGTNGGGGDAHLFFWAALGIYRNLQGAGSGGVGGSQVGADGSNATIAANDALTNGGGGGAGTTSADFAGGGFAAITGAMISDIRPRAPAAGSNPGSGGPPPGRPFYGYGGCGGSSSNAGVGGNGGPGGYGCGGGGGGAGTTGGRGGDGGPGLVIITSW